MPDMDGFDVLREMRSVALLKHIPVIIHSSRDLSGQERSLLSDDHVFIYPKHDFGRENGPRALVELLESAGVRL